jgi:hypothetical protein
MGVQRDGEEAVVAHLLAVWFGLLRLDRPDEPRLDQATGGNAFVEQQEDIERVAILAEGTKPKSKGKTAPAGSTPPRVKTASSPS